MTPDQSTNKIRIKSGTISKQPRYCQSLARAAQESASSWPFLWMEDRFDTADASQPPNAFNYRRVLIPSNWQQKWKQFHLKCQEYSPGKGKRLNLLNMKNDDFATWLHQLHVYMKRLQPGYSKYFFFGSESISGKLTLPIPTKPLNEPWKPGGKHHCFASNPILFPKIKTLRSETHPVFLRSFNA